MTGTMLKSMAVVLTTSLMACGGAEGSAVKVALQLVRSRPGLDSERHEHLATLRTCLHCR